MSLFALVLGEVDVQCIGEQIAREDTVGAGVDQALELRCGRICDGQGDRHERPEHWLAQARVLRILS